MFITINKIRLDKKGLYHSGTRKKLHEDSFDFDMMDKIEIIKDFIDKTMVKTEEITYDKPSYLFPLFFGRASGIGVSQGEFIYAMLEKGFRIKPQHELSLGCWFNLDWEEFKERYKEHYPGKRW